MKASYPWKQAGFDLQQKGIAVDSSRKLHDAAGDSMTLTHLPHVRLLRITGLVAQAPSAMLPATQGLAYMLTASCLFMKATDLDCKHAAVISGIVHQTASPQECMQVGSSLRSYRV